MNSPDTADKEQSSTSAGSDAPQLVATGFRAPKLLVSISLSSDTYRKAGSTPFWLALTLHNNEVGPLTISRTTRVIDLPTGLLHQCIAFRDTSNGSIVPYGCPVTSRLYMPSSRSGIPKRWMAEAKDLVTLPSGGSHTIYFELTRDSAETGWQKELWHQGFEVGKQYEVVIPEEATIMYWMPGTSEELLSVHNTLGPEWPQDHLDVKFMSESKAIFTVI